MRLLLGTPAMLVRTLIIERDDPAEPGLLIRRYARIGVCYEPTLGNWAWIRFNATGQLLKPKDSRTTLPR